MIKANTLSGEDCRVKENSFVLNIMRKDQPILIEGFTDVPQNDNLLWVILYDQQGEAFKVRALYHNQGRFVSLLNPDKINGKYTIGLLSSDNNVGLSLVFLIKLLV